jgi:hypothetical protein
MFSQFCTCFSLHFFLHGKLSSKHSVLSFMYCIALSTMPFSKAECRRCLTFKNLQTSGYYMPPSVDTGFLPWVLIKPERNFSVTNVFLSFDVFIAGIHLSSDSMATQIQINSGPTLIRVSSITYWTICFLLLNVFRGPNLCIQFQMET